MGSWFRCDAAARSILVTREAGGRLNALRNVCIHAGYPVCEAEEGAAERLMCPYHGWEYALDGRLVEPELSSRIDPSRLRLAQLSGTRSQWPDLCRSSRQATDELR